MPTGGQRWAIEYDERVEGDLRSLDHSARLGILSYLETRIAGSADPRVFGKPLRYSKRGLWRYRVGDYRIICHILDLRLIVLVVAVGHRSTIYR